MNLFHDEIQQFNKDGYFFIPQFFNQDEVKSMQDWIEEIASWPNEPGKHLNYYERVENKKVISRTENFLPYHQKFKEFLMGTKIFSLMEKVLQEPPFLFKEKINFKYKGTGKYNPHQDIHAYDTSPLAFQAYHVNCAIFVDDATIENGCFEVVPGYKDEILQRNADGSIVAHISENLAWQHLEAPAGSVLVFNCFVPHKSERNMSEQARRSIYLTFNGVSKGDLREAHYLDRASKKGKTREINTDLFIE